MTNKQLKKRIKDYGLTQRFFAKLFKKRPQQISAAVNSEEQPTLRKRIVDYLERI